jgi:hypothetical protein
MLIDSNSDEAQLSLFLAKCNNIPVAKFPYTHLILIGANEKDVARYWKLQRYDEIAGLFTHLESDSRIILNTADINKLVQLVQPIAYRSMNKVEKVFYALKTIGKPAHYEEVTGVYNQLFPEENCTAHSVQALLLRENNRIVWIGRRGTFALREWGYERPSMTLFDTVTKIVNDKFLETGRPVSIALITTELGKFRQEVNSASLFFATMFNPQLKSPSQGYFIPRSNDDEENINMDEKLDSILEEFEKNNQ